MTQVIKKPYKELLEDTRWKMKARAIRRRDRHTCQGCGAKNTILHVHHKRYYKDMPPWAVENEYLITLCEPCHEKEHEGKHISEFLYQGKKQKKQKQKQVKKQKRKNRNVVFSKPFVPKYTIEKPKLTQTEIKKKIEENKVYKENLIKESEVKIVPKKLTFDEMKEALKQQMNEIKLKVEKRKKIKSKIIKKK